MILKIKKRNGAIVDFDPQKITTAISKAFFEVRGGYDTERLREIAGEAVRTLETLFPVAMPSVEDVQDAVEKELMKAQYYDVVKAYIIYRYEHTRDREEKKRETLEKLEENNLFITKRSGARERFSPGKLRHSLARHIHGYEKDIDVERVVAQVRNEIYEDISTGDIERTLIMVLRSLIERDPAYSIVAARVLLGSIYKEVIGHDEIDFPRMQEQHVLAFVRNIHEGVSMGRLDRRMREFNLEEIAKKMDMGRDNHFGYLGLQTIHDRYLMRHPATKRLMETPQMFWMRIAMGTAVNEPEKNRWAAEFYRVMSDFLYTPSTPTLFHAGTAKPQLSSCYLNTVPDSLEGIFKSYADNAQLSKWSGGIGTDWTNIRGTGAYIQGTGVESQGVIPFLKIANDVTVAINRSGRRRGAACVYLETWHYDIEAFLELRKNTGDERRRTHDMDIANWIPDLFMKRVREDGDWTLFSSDEVPDLHHLYGRRFEARYRFYEQEADVGRMKLFKRMKARDMWKKMVTMLFETGHPWITFKDPCNIRSPQDHAGVVHSSNLCTEITLNTSEDETAVCNLGSLNFAKFVRQGAFDRLLVDSTVEIAMRMLDNVIDINFYPTPDSRRSNLRHRPVGLGIRGYQDALYLLGIEFDSLAAVEFADESMEAVAYAAILSSAELARERGVYESFRGSKWDRGILPVDTLDLLEQERGEAIAVPRAGRLDWTPVREAIRQHGMRNSNCLAIAPTATTANIVGCVPTIEPTYKNVFVKSNQAGDFIVVNDYLVQDLKRAVLWDEKMLEKIKFYDGSIQEIPEISEELKRKYKETFEIEPKWLIMAASRRGKWIDQSQSLNIYYRGSSGKELNDIYLMAWSLGLKTTYYLRTEAASQVEKATISTAEHGATHIRKEFVEQLIREESGAIEIPGPLVPEMKPASGIPLVLPPELPVGSVPMPLPSSPRERVPAMAMSASSDAYAAISLPSAPPAVRASMPLVSAPRVVTSSLSPGLTIVGKGILASGMGVNICSILDPGCESCEA